MKNLFGNCWQKQNRPACTGRFADNLLLMDYL